MAIEQHGQRRTFMPGWFAIARRLNDLPTWACYAIATVLVLLTTLLMRYIIVHDSPGYHFIFYVPTVAFCSLFLARGCGIWVVLLSAVLIKAFLLGPVLEFGSQEELWALVLFLATGLVTALASEGLHKAFFDINRAKAKLLEAYERIAASEHEKELLLQELVHRFKNDLANITAILRLQARDVADPSARSELIAASERVYVMSRVHQRFARSGDAVSADIREFVLDLCQDLRVGMIGARPIILRAEIEHAQFPLSQAIILGLIVNELVTNAIKHAFPNDRPGTITVAFTRARQEFCLRVDDDGVGKAAAGPTSSGLGQRLIRSLASQLGATFEMESFDTGRKCTVRFPAAKDLRTQSAA